MISLVHCVWGRGVTHCGLGGLGSRWIFVLIGLSGFDGGGNQDDDEGEMGEWIVLSILHPYAGAQITIRKIERYVFKPLIIELN